MYQPRGRALLASVTALTSLGFLLIGYDNGLMGGLGKFALLETAQGSIRTDDIVVNGTAFKKSFDTPSSTMIGVIVAIYEGERPFARGSVGS